MHALLRQADMDDAPIPLRLAFDSPYRSDETVLRAIDKHSRELQAARV
jgi:formylmethanofuran dehydrogenase subunit B